MKGLNSLVEEVKLSSDNDDDGNDEKLLRTEGAQRFTVVYKTEYVQL